MATGGSNGMISASYSQKDEARKEQKLSDVDKFVIEICEALKEKARR